jgi:hypothetical protein
LRQMLQCIWDPDEFRSEYGLRSLSKYHAVHPFVFGNQSVPYSPGEALAKIKGGNSNWRGPLWFPTTFLMIESLRKLGKAFGRGFAIASRTATSARHHIVRVTCRESRLMGLFPRALA